jgi:hypothetical protein
LIGRRWTRRVQANTAQRAHGIRRHVHDSLDAVQSVGKGFFHSSAHRRPGFTGANDDNARGLLKDSLKRRLSQRGADECRWFRRSDSRLPDGQCMLA